MFSRVSRRAFSVSARQNAKVAVLGAAGGIGQPLSLLLKASPLVTDLTLFDIVNTPGVAADLSHISTAAPVAGYNGDAELELALKDREVVLIPAGVPRKPGMSRDDLFNTNASIVQTLAVACAKHCPKAKILIIANPVNSTVPIAVEAFKKAGVYDPKKIFGVTTLDVVRAKTFISQLKGVNVNDLKVTVVGGHSGHTIVPLLSQTGLSFTDEERSALTHRIQFGGDEVVQAKAGAGSATLSMAYAAAVFTDSIIKAQNGETGIVEATFVDSDVESTPYFSTLVELGPEGVSKILPVGDVSEFEEDLLKTCRDELQKNIDKGVAFSKN